MTRRYNSLNSSKSIPSEEKKPSTARFTIMGSSFLSFIASCANISKAPDSGEFGGGGKTGGEEGALIDTAANLAKVDKFMYSLSSTNPTVNVDGKELAIGIKDTRSQNTGDFISTETGVIVVGLSNTYTATISYKSTNIRSTDEASASIITLDGGGSELLITSHTSSTNETAGLTSERGAVSVIWDFVDSFDSAISASGRVYAYSTFSSYGNGPSENINMLTLWGEGANDRLGEKDPIIWSMDSANDLDDMIVASPLAKDAKGAIYILWDINQYKGAAESPISPAVHIIAGKESEGDSFGNSLQTVFSGSNLDDRIGMHRPELILRDSKLDMVLRAETISTGGGVYIIWDAASYKPDSGISNVILSPSNSLLIKGDNGEGIGYKNIILADFDNDEVQDYMILNNSANDADSFSYILWGDLVNGKKGVIDLGDKIGDKIKAFSEEGDGVFMNAGSWVSGNGDDLKQDIIDNYYIRVNSDGQRSWLNSETNIADISDGSLLELA